MQQKSVLWCVIFVIIISSLVSFIPLWFLIVAGITLSIVRYCFTYCGGGGVNKIYTVFKKAEVAGRGRKKDAKEDINISY